MSSKVIATLMFSAGILGWGVVHAQSNPAEPPADAVPPPVALADPAGTIAEPAAAAEPAATLEPAANAEPAATAEPAPPWPPFFSQLAPFGKWIYGDERRWTWVPAAVPEGWKPYTVGHWEVSSYGWTWMSDEPFGWATFHYGRWFRDRKLGWTWIPGEDFAAAWVDWRAGNGYTGWAPLRPDQDAEPPAYEYSFVKDSTLLAPSLADALLPAGDDSWFVAHSTPVVAPPLPDPPPPPPGRWARAWPYISAVLEGLSDVTSALPSGTHASAEHASPRPVSPAHPTGQGAQQPPPTPPAVHRIDPPAAKTQAPGEASRPRPAQQQTQQQNQPAQQQTQQREQPARQQIQPPAQSPPEPHPAATADPAAHH